MRQHNLVIDDWKEKLGQRNVEQEAFSGHKDSLGLYRFISEPVWSQWFQVIGIQALMSNGDGNSMSAGDWRMWLKYVLWANFKR